MAIENGPLVSVIVPTYKRADRLTKALNSISNQSYKNLEILVVNDNEVNSKWDKETNKVLLACEDSRLRTIHTAGRTGGGSARNYACRQAMGDYLAFLDDDEFLSDKVETQLVYMLKTASICAGRMSLGITSRVNSWSIAGSIIVMISQNRVCSERIY